MHKEFTALLDRFKKQNIKNSRHFERMSEVSISYHSAVADDSSLTKEETTNLLIDGITANGKSLNDQNMVKDYHDALLFTLNLATKKQSLTPRLIQTINALLMRTSRSLIDDGTNLDKPQSVFRSFSTQQRSFYYANYQRIPLELELLCGKINHRIKQIQNPEEVYDFAFYAHFYLMNIFPFSDGNRRTAHLLMNYILKYRHQPLAIVFKEDKADYLKALKKAKTKLQIFRDFMYSQQIKYLSQTDNFIKSKEN